MRFGSTQILNNFGILSIQLSSRFKVMFLKFLMSMFKFTNIASSKLQILIFAHSLNSIGQIINKQIIKISSLFNFFLKLNLIIFLFLLFLFPHLYYTITTFSAFSIYYLLFLYIYTICSSLCSLLLINSVFFCWFLEYCFNHLPKNSIGN